MTAGDYYYGGEHRYPNTDLNNNTAFNVNVGFNFLEEHRIGVTVLGVNADKMGSPNYYNNLTPRAYSDRSNYSADLLYEGGYKDFGLSWKGRYFFGKNSYKTDDPDEPWGPGESLFKTYTDYQGSQGQLTFKKSFLTLTGGVDWLHYDLDSRASYYLDGQEKSSYNNIGVFALAKLAFFDDALIFSGGLRHDEYRLKYGEDKKNLDRTTPSLGVAWHVTDWLTLKGNYGESFRVPSPLEVLGSKGMYTYLPNPDAKPEEAKTYDAGFEIAHKSLNLGLTYFETEYKNKLITRSVGWDTQYYNVDGKIRLKGLEGNISYDIGEAFEWPVRLRPYVNFTHILDKKSTEEAIYAGTTKVLNVSDFDLAYGLNFKYPDFGFEADLRFTYMGHQYVRDFNSSAYPSPVVKIGGKTTADLFLSQRIHEWQDAGTLSVNAAVRNIFDERYALIKDYPMPGRSFYLGFRYDY
ncbi:MAG: TonB-dependent receptor [Desulfovibrio sp.]|nr:TonB-dependent receptor [Desulfovibrio sp.]